MCELACMFCALLHALGYVKRVFFLSSETKQDLGSKFCVAVSMSAQDCRGGAGVWGGRSS